MMTTVAFALAAASSGKSLPLERIHQDPPLEGRPPLQVQLEPGGRFVTFLKPSERDSQVLDLWAAALPDGKPTRLVSAQEVLAGAEEKRTEQEKMALERKRISHAGITSALWCGDRGDKLLFPLSGDLYLFDLGRRQATKLTRDGDGDDAPALAPTCDPTGRRVAFVRQGNVFLLDIATRQEERLTRGASATRTFGLAEFIAAEEMGRHEGMWWSPDGNRLLVFEVDESAVGVKLRPQIYADKTLLVEQRYPAAGERNAVVKAHVFDVERRRRLGLITFDEDGYLARGGFFPDGAPFILWQSRDQKRLRLFEADRNGRARLVFEEHDDTWLELHDDLRALGGAHVGKLLWSSERSGRRQLELVDRKTGARTPLTQEPEPVEALLGVDEKEGVVFYSAARDSGRQLHVFAQPLAGGPARQLTEADGWHAAAFDKAGRYFVDTWSDFGVPPRVDVRDASGKVVLELDDNPAADLQHALRPTPQWLTVQADDGTPLNALLLPPVNGTTAARSTPAIAYVYGGPTAQTVVRRWMKQYPLFVHWTQRGYAVLLVDNRGTASRGRAFSRALHNRIGDLEVGDLFDGVRQILARAPSIDPSRVGVYGWSYGGFLASRAILDEKTPFAAAAAGAPVTDWTLYDTHYTERYIGVPASSPAYAASNLVARAKLLRRPLLLLHGTADDNVLFEHTLRLAEALQKESLPFEMMVYPGKAHGVSGRAHQLHVAKTITAFFDRHLAPPPPR